MCSSTGTWDTLNWPELAAAVENATGGRLKIKVFVPGEHPYKGSDLPKAIKDGEAEIVNIAGGYVSAVEPRLAVLDQPMLCPGGDFKTWREVFAILSETYFKDVWADWNCQLLIPHHWGGQQIYLDEGFVENWDSLKGKSLRTWSVETANLIRLLNGTALAIDWSEVYTSLQTGLIEGLVTSFFAAYNTRLTEVCKNINMITMQYATTPYVVNLDALAELPPDVKNTLFEVMEARWDSFEAGTVGADGLALQEAFLTDNIKAHAVPPAFREEITSKAYEGIWKPWMDRVGPEGADAFNEVAKILIDKGFEVPGYTPH